MVEIHSDLDKGGEARTDGSAEVRYPRTLPSDLLEGFVSFFGKLFEWIWAPLVLLAFGNAMLRYILGINVIALEELQWHLYAAGFMIGLSYCFIHDGHVRVDVLAERFRPRTRALIEILGTALLFLPFCFLILAYAYPFVETSYRFNEVSAAPGGLPMRWLIKSFILYAFVLLVMAGLARLIRAFSLLTGFPRAI